MLHDNALYLKSKEKKLVFNLGCEVGVYFPETSNLKDFIIEGLNTILIEPSEKYIKLIENYFGSYNIRIFPFAIYDYNGILELINCGASSFAKSLPQSPALINDNYKIDKNDIFEVECKIFSEVDNGFIDLLSVDTEGSEWYVLKYMISRPNVISLETHGKYYINPFISEINQWIKENDYQIWFKTKSDTVYFRKGIIVLSISEKINLLIMNFYLRLRKLKRFLKFLRFVRQ